MKMLAKFFLLVVFFGFASALTVDEIISGLKENRQKIQSYEADVINYVSGAYVQNNNTQAGHVYFQAPSLLRTDTTEPAFQVVVANGHKSFFIDQTGEVKEIAQEANKLEKELSDPIKLFEKFNFILEEQPNDLVKLIGIPKAVNAKDAFSTKVFSKIVFYINKKNSTTQEIRIHNANGAEIAQIKTKYLEINGVQFPQTTETSLSLSKSKLVVKTTYSNIQLNKSIDKSKFDVLEIQKEIKAKGGN